MIKKILIGLFVFITLLIGALVAIPFVFKDEINARIKKEVNKQVNASVDYSSFDLSLIRSFPDLSFSLFDLSIVGIEKFEGDTLAKVDRIDLGFDLMSVINGGVMKIHKVNIEHPMLKALEMTDDNTGELAANYDIVPESETETTSEAQLALEIESFTLNDGLLYYLDVNSGLELIVSNLKTKSKASYKNDIADFVVDLSSDSIRVNDGSSKIMADGFSITAEGDYKTITANILSKIQIESLTFIEEGSQLLKDAKLISNLDIAADLENMSFNFNENDIAINNLKMAYDGLVKFPGNGVDLDMKFASNSATFKELLSLIPMEYLKDYEGINANGTFSISGNAKGLIADESTPTFNLDLAINNGSIKYPDLPTSVEAINLTANVNNSTNNLKNTIVRVSNATFTIENEPVKMSLLARNMMDDPYVETNIVGKLDLSKVPNFYPLEGVRNIAGLVDANIDFKGVVSDIEKENYEQINLAGELLVSNFIYDAVDLPMPITMKTASLEFNPKKATLKNLEAKFGKSDLKASGSLENIVGYLLSEEGVLKGAVNIQSNYLDLTELMVSEEPSSTSTSEKTMESEIVKIPPKVTLVGDAKINEILYDGITLKNVNGGVVIDDEKLTVKSLRANLLGGSATINGSYSTKDTEKPILDFSYDIQKFSIEESFNYLNTVQAIAPIAKYLKGTFSSDMSFNSFINPDLSIDLASLSGLGDVKIPYATIVDLPIFEKLSGVMNIAKIEKPILENAWTILKFEDGKVNVEPFQIKAKDMVMDIQGSNGFDESINYTMKINVPSDKFGGAASVANSFLAKQNIPLFNLSVPQSLNFFVNADGTLNNPNVKIAKVTADKSDKGIKEQIKDNVKQQVNDAVDKAKAEAEKAKQEAINKAKAEAEKAKQDAIDKAKEEAEKAKQDAKDKVKDKIKGFGW